MSVRYDAVDIDIALLSLLGGIRGVGPLHAQFQCPHVAASRLVTTV